ncbi:MAG: sulfur carrier protein ThiS [Holophagales bacterium]|nr:sulfur carrier protein ThiS [Holophagales bacterium]MYH24104.1 sulfur carrier protein ThiS [Holophagales bacterium]
MRLEVNGQERELSVPGADASVLDLLASLDQHPKTVAVEVNRELVPRARFGDTSLHDGDRVEIVRFVQGGRAADRV